VTAESESRDWVDLFPGLSQLETPARQVLLQRSTLIDVPAGTVLFGPGKTAEHMLFLLEGTVRVQHLSDSGREIVLYRVGGGESCVLTTACLMGYAEYSAEGIAETEVRAAAVPRLVFDDLVAQSPSFRNFVFTAFSRRITDLFLVIDEIAFQRMDVRLAQRLLEISKGDDRIETTHQRLAVELGTAREVVSRQLQEFQRRGWIRQARGSVHIQDRGALLSLAEDAAKA
jgi:CRP/FNR family transcriptional regulator